MEKDAIGLVPDTEKVEVVERLRCREKTGESNWYNTDGTLGCTTNYRGGEPTGLHD